MPKIYSRGNGPKCGLNLKAAVVLSRENQFCFSLSVHLDKDLFFLQQDKN